MAEKTKGKKRGRPSLGAPGSFHSIGGKIAVSDLRKLRSLAKKEKVSVSHLIRVAIQDLLKENNLL